MGSDPSLSEWLHNVLWRRLLVKVSARLPIIIKDRFAEGEKGKGDHASVEHRWGAHPHTLAFEIDHRIDHWVCDEWPVRRQTYDYLPSCRASPSLGQIILLGDRTEAHVCEQLVQSCCPAKFQKVKLTSNPPTIRSPWILCFLRCSATRSYPTASGMPLKQYNSNKKYNSTEQ